MKLTATGHRSDRDTAWRTLGDTDWMNRVGGNGRVLEMSIRPDEHGYPLVVGALEGPLGTRIPFTELDSSWSHRRFFRQERAFESPFIARSCYRFDLERDGDAVIPRITFEYELSSKLLGAFAVSQIRKMMARWQQVLSALPAPGDVFDPGDVAVHEPLPSAARSALTRWADDGASTALVERFATHFTVGSPTELQRLRAFQLADRWGLDREALLVSMLRGVRAGALELYWSVRCPRCYAQVDGVPTLGDLADHATCSSCRIGFDPDLGRDVEVLFAPHPSVAPRAHDRFCTLFPSASPELHGVFVVQPGGRVETELDVRLGPWLLGAGGDAADTRVHAIDDEGATDRLAWRRSLDPTHAQVRAGTVRLGLDNDGPGRVRILAAPQPDSASYVPASLLTTLPEFRRSLGHQVLSPDLRISVRSVALLFTDLSGSTAMYEELGDAPAFALVRDHFELLRAAIEDHGGVVVKTIGDAVMASFHRADRALAAALAIQRLFAEWIGTRGLEAPPGLKVGVHVGPALAVHSDQSGLDYFGRTVNIAARAEGRAAAGEVIWSDAVHDDDDVQALLAGAGIVGEPIEATLKGIRDVVRLYRATPWASGRRVVREIGRGSTHTTPGQS